ncbi:solute carrier family 26 member 10-like [Brachionus plicatilis]|uniref:Solute carrier family 26 member 10-like n=1 Tax=Brachionus plicatilis TaxID=10195 RepID=A0A3M7T1R1_BRAPC|nr:solute carrier family 26 member 10-like [Brachionus plicatilis]
MNLNKKKSSSQLPIYGGNILDTEEIYGSNSNFDIYSEKKLEQTFSYNKVKGDNVLKSSVNYFKKYYNPTPDCMKTYFFDRFPFFKWIRKYNFKNNFFKDLIAGLTIGIVHIPQGLAYSLMAGLPAINGLYVSFINVILYVLLGTSRHLSTGTYAIVSLMVASSINKYKGVLYPLDYNSTANLTESVPSSSEFISNDPDKARVLIATCLALFSGAIQVIFALFHIGVVTKFLSDSIVNGFTCGAAFHVVVSQISTLLGIKIGDVHLAFVLVGELIEIGSHILDTKIFTLLISLISMLFLYVVKVFINEKFKKKLPVPVPVELIVVVVGTISSYFGEFNRLHDVIIIGELKKGFPAPTAPPVKLISQLFGDSLAIAIVSFAINVSMAKLFAKKHKYEISPNQELISYGVGNIVSSFFSGFPSCVGLSRCVIVEDVGGRTQVYGIFASILVLVVILFLGPLFGSLPNACLAAIIVIALKSMVLEVKNLPNLFKKSKIEALGWLMTFLGVMILDVDVGLYIGVGFSLLLVIIRSQRARATVLGNIPGTRVYECIDACEQAQEFENIKIIRYEESIYYANVDNFKYKIYKLCGLKPEEVQKKLKKANSKSKNYQRDHKTAKEIMDEIKLKHIILDFSCVNYIDSQGVNAVIQLHEEYKEIGIILHLTYCKRMAIRSFKKHLLPNKIDLDFIFATNDDAVRNILFPAKPMIKIEDSSNSIYQNVRMSISDADEEHKLTSIIIKKIKDEDHIEEEEENEDKYEDSMKF